MGPTHGILDVLKRLLILILIFEGFPPMRILGKKKKKSITKVFYFSPTAIATIQFLFFLKFKVLCYKKISICWSVWQQGEFYGDLDLEIQIILNLLKKYKFKK